MSVEKSVLVFVTLFGSVLGQWDPVYAPGRAGMIHLFEWSWDTIADECETFLAPNKYGGVQVSPPNENVIIENRPWWERYQSVSYKLITRGGNRQQFANMVDRCNNVGVRIYVDAIINHMASSFAGQGNGTGGSYYDTSIERYDGVPYSSLDFNDGICPSSNGGIENNGDINQIRNCQLVGLQDLNMGKDYVRGKIIDFMNDLISLGVAGFRVDACNHMWPLDLEAIFLSLDDLPTSKGFEPGTKAYIMQEVIARPHEPVNPLQYYPLGQLTEFNYALEINKNRNKIHYLSTFGEAWGLYPSKYSLVFLNNHDNQRRDDQYIDFHQAYDLKIFTAFMMAWPFGLPRIMSSYHYTNSDQGPPPHQRSVNSDGSCGNGWVCEHRWRQIKNMAAFSVVARDQPVLNWWTNHGNQIAFSRGSNAFLAINKAGTSMDEYLTTGLPAGRYCDVISGNYNEGSCTGSCIYVDENSVARITIPPNSDPMIALHVDATCSSPDPIECTTCSSCTVKVDCGVVGSDQTDCESRGCMWCPDEGCDDPWCVRNIVPSNGTQTLPSCDVAERTDCSYVGIDQSKCEISGCCWSPSDQQGVPWCHHTT